MLLNDICRILYYDNDLPSVLPIIEMFRHQAGIKVEHAVNYSDAVLSYRNNTPDIIVVNIGSENRSAVDFIKEVRRSEGEIPIVITSANPQKDYLLEAVNLNIEKYITKPLKKEYLLEIVNKINEGAKIYTFKNGFKFSPLKKRFTDKNGMSIKFSYQEIIFIEELLKNSEKYCSYGMLQEAIGKTGPVSIETLRTLVKSIRKKTYHDIIVNLSGVGYKINLADTDKGPDSFEHKINILICDDQKSNLRFLEILILNNFEDVNLIFSSGGKEAIEILKNRRVDIVLLDIHMPEIDGWQVAQFIQEKLKEQNIAIIFITSVYIEDEFEKRGCELGAVDYITKPINRGQLINRLRLYIKNFMQEKNLLKEMKKNREKEKLLLQKEIMLAQANILEKIAHHWRRPLSVISSNAGFIEYYLEMGIDDNSDAIHKSCKFITSETEGLSKTIEQFKTFFH